MVYQVNQVKEVGRIVGYADALKEGLRRLFMPLV